LKGVIVSLTIDNLNGFRGMVFAAFAFVEKWLDCVSSMMVQVA
jgi:hypothetical protein